MFSLGSNNVTFPLPGKGMTIKKLVFPLKGKLATWMREKDCLFISFISYELTLKTIGTHGG